MTIPTSAAVVKVVWYCLSQSDCGGSAKARQDRGAAETNRASGVESVGTELAPGGEAESLFAAAVRTPERAMLSLKARISTMQSDVMQSRKHQRDYDSGVEHDTKIHTVLRSTYIRDSTRLSRRGLRLRHLQGTAVVRAAKGR